MPLNITRKDEAPSPLLSELEPLTVIQIENYGAPDDLFIVVRSGCVECENNLLDLQTGELYSCDEKWRVSRVWRNPTLELGE